MGSSRDAASLVHKDCPMNWFDSFYKVVNKQMTYPKGSMGRTELKIYMTIGFLYNLSFAIIFIYYIFAD